LIAAGRTGHTIFAELPQPAERLHHVSSGVTNPSVTPIF